MHQQLILYGTSCCHLCELAETLVQSCLQSTTLLLQAVDIAGNDALEQRYAVRIPVLRYGNMELDWPFDSKTVSDLILERKTKKPAR